MGNNNSIDMRWCEEDLVLERFNSKSPYRQGEPTVQEIREVFEQYVPSVPNIVTPVPYDIIRRPVF